MATRTFNHNRPARIGLAQKQYPEKYSVILFLNITNRNIWLILMRFLGFATGFSLSSPSRESVVGRKPANLLGNPHLESEMIFMRRIRTTPFLLIILAACCSLSHGQTESERSIEVTYSEMLTAMKAKNHVLAGQVAKEFKNRFGTQASTTALYNVACALALSEQQDAAIELLQYVVEKRYYSKIEHLESDSDLTHLHDHPKWTELLAKVKQNLATRGDRLKKTIASELKKAKEILEKDDGELWGHRIWSNDILVLDFDNTIYSLVRLPESQTDESGLYFKKMGENELSFTNSAQQYNGKTYAVVMANYLDDQSSTIIHELFHILQLAARKFNGDPVDYLDNQDAREWLRMEYHALRAGLQAAQQRASTKLVRDHLEDALRFRKVRQTQYAAYRQGELEIETLEGMANYTGIVLSTYDDKYAKAIREIKQREAAQTYTRPFPYATGPAYGMLLDYLKIDWKSDLKTIYNFLEIYESDSNKPISVDDVNLKRAQQRHDYQNIHAQELKRKQEYDDNVAFYTRLLINQPTLRARLTDGDKNYSMTFNMNGTLVLGEYGTVYSSIKGIDGSGNHFGSFETLAGKDRLGESGILRLAQNGEFVFPYPTQITDRMIRGENYEIQLNEGWETKKSDQTGNLVIVRKIRAAVDN